MCMHRRSTRQLEIGMHSSTGLGEWLLACVLARHAKRWDVFFYFLFFPSRPR